MSLIGTRVLIVEDEGMVAMLMEILLEHLGCTVVGSAARLDDALAKSQALEFDLAVLDVNLAGTLSYPLAKALRGRDIPFIFTTGYGASGLPEELKDALVLTKPYDQRQLASMLEAVKKP
jgi:CheY-like chemotaxis protein